MANFEPRTLDDKARRMDLETARSGRGMEGLVPPAPVQDMRGGGLVPPGPEGVDTVPAVMEGGTAMLDAPPGEGRQEYVLTPEMVEALGGVEQLDRLRAAVHDSGQVEARREMDGEGMVPAELMGQEGAPMPPMSPQEEPMLAPEEVPQGLVPRMANGGMEDDYFNARLANGGVLRNNAGAQIGVVGGAGQVLDERGRARAYLGGMADGGAPSFEGLLPRTFRWWDEVKAREPDFDKPAYTGNTGTAPVAAPVAPAPATPAPTQRVEDYLTPKPARSFAPGNPPAAPTLAPAAAQDKYKTGPWEFLKPGLYGSPRAPFTVTDEGGVQVIRGPGDMSQRSSADMLASPKGRSSADEEGYFTPTVIADERTGRQIVMQARKDGGPARLIPVEQMQREALGPDVEERMDEISQIREPEKRKRAMLALEQYAGMSLPWAESLLNTARAQ